MKHQDIDLIINASTANKQNSLDTNFEQVSLFGRPVKFTPNRMRHADIPDGLYIYEIMHSDTDWSKPVALQLHTLINFMGTVLTTEPICSDSDNNYVPISDDDWLTQDEFDSTPVVDSTTQISALVDAY